MGAADWNNEEAILKRLREWLSSTGEGPGQRPVSFNPRVWKPRLERHPTALSVMEGLASDDDGMGLVDRDDLRRIAGHTAQQGYVPLFAACMIWGSGRTNGRGPRNTQKALDCPDIETRLRGVADLVREGHSGDAYQRTRIPGVGGPFLTKFLWAVGTTLPPMHVRPLILDSRVWYSLNELLRWNSLLAAGTRSWAARYEAYLSAMYRWAAAVGVAHPEQLELLLFLKSA